MKAQSRRSLGSSLLYLVSVVPPLFHTQRALKYSTGAQACKSWDRDRSCAACNGEVQHAGPFPGEQVDGPEDHTLVEQ